MKALSAAGALLIALGCTVSPVVTNPEGSHGRYDECRRASQDYCRDALGSIDSELKKCVAEATYNCVTGMIPQ